MSRSEKMEKEVSAELERNGHSRQEADNVVRGMRTNEVVRAYYQPSSIKNKEEE